MTSVPTTIPPSHCQRVTAPRMAKAMCTITMTAPVADSPERRFKARAPQSPGGGAPSMRSIRGRGSGRGQSGEDSLAINLVAVEYAGMLLDGSDQRIQRAACIDAELEPAPGAADGLPLRAISDLAGGHLRLCVRVGGVLLAHVTLLPLS